MRKKILIINVLVCVIAVILMLVFTNNSTSRLVLNVQPADAIVEIDGKKITKTEVKLKKGEYIVQAEKQGYITTQTTITISGNTEQTISITLLKSTPKNTAEQEIQKFFSDNGLFEKETTELELTDVKSFYDNTWLLGITKIKGERSIFVLKKGEEGGYTLLTGPGKYGDYFEEDSSSEIPQDVFNEAKRLIRAE